MKKLVVHSEIIPALEYGTNSCKRLGSSLKDNVINQQCKDNNRNKYVQDNSSLESSVFDFWKKMIETYIIFMILAFYSCIGHKISKELWKSLKPKIDIPCHFLSFYFLFCKKLTTYKNIPGFSHFES